MLEIGMKAPEFTLPDKDGNAVSLSDFTGKKVVVYFYSKDNTSGCTKQACAFADAYGTYKDQGVEIIGISKDTAASHKKFADKHELPFILLADPEHTALKAYGVWQEKTHYTYLDIKKLVFHNFLKSVLILLNTLITIHFCFLFLNSMHHGRL